MSASEVAHYRSDQHDLWIGENGGHLILEGFVLGDVLACLGVIVVSGAVLTFLSLRALASYDRD